jgi:hypothetical protein
MDAGKFYAFDEISHQAFSSSLLAETQIYFVMAESLMEWQVGQPYFFALNFPIK